jgi:DNA topoisomerase-3
MGVAPCPACEGGSPGTLVLDPVGAPAWRLDCSRCSFLVYLPKNLHSARVAPDTCEVGRQRAAAAQACPRHAQSNPTT